MVLGLFHGQVKTDKKNPRLIAQKRMRELSGKVSVNISPSLVESLQLSNVC